MTLVPDELDPTEAVSLALTYVTAFQLLHRYAKIKSNEQILIHGAAGAVGWKRTVAAVGRSERRP